TLNVWNLQTLLSSFVWIIVIATTAGLILSFTRLRKYEGYGASKWGSIFIYIMVATIGMRMNFKDIIENAGLFVLGGVWMLVHVILLLVVAKIIRAPIFFVAVGSQANVGGAASAPVVASAFSPSLSAVGVLMALLGYTLGTYFAIVCAYLMQFVSNWLCCVCPDIAHAPYIKYSERRGDGSSHPLISVDICLPYDKIISAKESIP